MGASSAMVNGGGFGGRGRLLASGMRSDKCGRSVEEIVATTTAALLKVVTASAGYVGDMSKCCRFGPNMRVGADIFWPRHKIFVSGIANTIPLPCCSAAPLLRRSPAAATPISCHCCCFVKVAG